MIQYKFVRLLLLCHTLELIIIGRAQHGSNSFNSPKTRPILPADSYRILGEPGFRRFGQCNLTYAWLIAPPTSSLDAYGHATACTRLQLADGHIIPTSTTESFGANKEKNQAEDQLRRINKELSASIVDMERLDDLLRAEPFNFGQSRQLASEARYFFLANRIGDLNLMVVLRPGKQVKLEIINPLSAENLVVTPQHILCSRKQCPAPISKPKLQQPNSDKVADAKLMSNTTLASTAAALNKSERQNRDLYLQLVVSRVVCALIGFMCVVFAITSLMLCIKLRHQRYNFKKNVQTPEFNTPNRDHHPSPSFYQMNGKISVPQASPLFMTEQSPRHFSLNQLPSETASMNNVMMTTSNMSNCDGQPTMQNVALTYGAMSSQYGQMGNYQLTTNQPVAYKENPGLITLYTVPSNGSVSSVPRGLLLPYQNGSTSPVPSNHSQCDGKTTGSKSGSLGRQSRTSWNYGEFTKRKLIQQYKMAQQHQSFLPHHQPDSEAMGVNLNHRPTPKLHHNRHILKHDEYAIGMLKSDNADIESNDLISFTKKHTFNGASANRYPEILTNTSKPASSINSEDEGQELNKSKGFASAGDNCIGVILKPAHAN